MFPPFSVALTNRKSKFENFRLTRDFLEKRNLVILLEKIHPTNLVKVIVVWEKSGCNRLVHSGTTRDRWQTKFCTCQNETCSTYLQLYSHST